MAESKSGKRPLSASERQARRKKQRRKNALRWVRALLLALVIGLCLRGFVFEIVRIQGPSMSTTLESGDLVLVAKFDYLFGRPQTGDIALCRFPGRSGQFVKRVTGTPGDTIAVVQGALERNGQRVEEPYVTLPAQADFAPVTLQENQYFVMGDNRLKSRDSREPEIGALGEGAFSGRVRFRLWPFEIF